MARDYTITGQRQLRDYDLQRNLVDFYEVYYQGTSGITGSVKVPVAEADPDYVDQLIRQRISGQLQIQQLGERG